METEAMAAMGAELAKRPAPGQRTTNVMVVYQNEETQKWAQGVCPQSNGTPVRATWWNLYDLAEPGVLAGAVSTAMRADVIIVSVIKGAGLPLPFYVWVNSWLPHRHVTEGKLIRLLGITADSPKCADASRGYFRQLAERGHLRLEEKECLLSGAVAPRASAHGTRREAPRAGRLRLTATATV